MTAHRVHRRDAETITNSAIGGTAPALDHDVVFTTEIDDVPDNQKIAREPEVADEREFFFELPFYLGTNRRIALLRPEPDGRPQERTHVMTRRNRKRWKFVTDVFERKR